MAVTTESKFTEQLVDQTRIHPQTQELLKKYISREITIFEFSVGVNQVREMCKKYQMAKARNGIPDGVA